MFFLGYFCNIVENTIYFFIGSTGYHLKIMKIHSKKFCLKKTKWIYDISMARNIQKSAISEMGREISHIHCYLNKLNFDVIAWAPETTSRITFIATLIAWEHGKSGYWPFGIYLETAMTVILTLTLKS